MSSCDGGVLMRYTQFMSRGFGGEIGVVVL